MFFFDIRKNMNQKIIEVDQIGKVTLRKSPRAKRISIHVKAIEGVSVTLPAASSYKLAIHFVIEKQDWIKRSLQKMQHLEQQYTIFDTQTDFTTRYHKLKIKPHKKQDIVTKIANKHIVFYYPEQHDIKDKNIQKAIRQVIEHTWRQEAKYYLPIRVDYWAKKFHLNYRQVKINSAKKRWGSCSGKNNINLSLYLMRLPDYLIDYVILHELAHTLEKNHSKRFWHLLDKLSGNAKALDKELRNYRVEVY